MRLTKHSLVAYPRAINRLTSCRSIFVDESLYGLASGVQQLLVSNYTCLRLHLLCTHEVLVVVRGCVGDGDHVNVCMDPDDVHMEYGWGVIGVPGMMAAFLFFHSDSMALRVGSVSTEEFRHDIVEGVSP